LLNPLDITVLSLVAFAQWRIGRLWLRTAERRSIGAARARAVLWAYCSGLAVSFLLGFPAVAVPLGVESWFALAAAVAYVWAFTSTAAYWVYELVALAGAWISPRPMNPARRRLLNAAGGALVASPLAAIGYGALVGRTGFQVREVDVPIPNLPADLEGLRVVHLSDIHLSAFLSEGELERVIDAANGARPHVAVVTGDMITTRGDPLDACLRQMARLRSDAGVLATMGNHEEYARAKEYAAREGARLGIRFLRSETETLRFGAAELNFAGVDYEPVSRRGRYLRGAERLRKPGAVNVMLTHNPDVFPEAARKGYDLTLSGHTHGGQVTVEILDQALNPARFLTPFVYGLYRSGERSAYVTRGIGTVGIPARLGAPPEIALLRLTKA
jgi:uncharacterized protein